LALQHISVQHTPKIHAQQADMDNKVYKPDRQRHNQRKECRYSPGYTPEGQEDNKDKDDQFGRRCRTDKDARQSRARNRDNDRKDKRDQKMAAYRPTDSDEGGTNFHSQKTNGQ
jgi:hypothetical protein